MYCEDWGEGLTNKSVPVMCVVNLQNGAVTVLQGVPQDVSPGQVRVSEATSTVVDIHSRWCWSDDTFSMFAVECSLFFSCLHSHMAEGPKTT